MDLTNLGTLPLAGVGATMLYQILGPSVKYLGAKGESYTQKMLENLEQAFKEAYKRLPKDKPEGGGVPPRLLHSMLEEAAYTEDQVAAAYLGGVLASSNSEDSRDDRGVAINATIARLSTYQIRAHYVLYTAMHDLYQGVYADRVFDVPHLFRVYYGWVGFTVALGFHGSELHQKDFDFGGALQHIFDGLDREGLIAAWEYGQEKGILCAPSSLGIELFLWANGHGRRSPYHFFSRHFNPVPAGDESTVSMIRGRGIKGYSIEEVEGENRITFTFDGYDLENPSRIGICSLNEPRARSDSRASE